MQTAHCKQNLTKESLSFAVPWAWQVCLLRSPMISLSPTPTSSCCVIEKKKHEPVEGIILWSLEQDSWDRYWLSVHSPLEMKIILLISLGWRKTCLSLGNPCCLHQTSLCQRTLFSFDIKLLWEYRLHGLLKQQAILGGFIYHSKNNQNQFCSCRHGPGRLFGWTPLLVNLEFQ